MTNPLVKAVGAIDTRLKRLESNIGTSADFVLRFLSINEAVSATDTVYIYKRDMNDSFLVGTSKVGVDKVGDRRGVDVLLWSGG